MNDMLSYAGKDIVYLICIIVIIIFDFKLLSSWII